MCCHTYMLYLPPRARLTSACPLRSLRRTAPRELREPTVSCDIMGPQCVRVWCLLSASLPSARCLRESTTTTTTTNNNNNNDNHTNENNSNNDMVIMMIILILIVTQMNNSPLSLSSAAPPLRESVGGGRLRPRARRRRLTI